MAVLAAWREVASFHHLGPGPARPAQEAAPTANSTLPRPGAFSGDRIPNLDFILEDTHLNTSPEMFVAQLVPRDGQDYSQLTLPAEGIRDPSGSSVIRTPEQAALLFPRAANSHYLQCVPIPA